METEYFECDTCSSGWSGDSTSGRFLDKLDDHERNNPGHHVKQVDGQ